ncbi:glucose 1-dehydrogenase [Compostibacter hankyongensis]|uniref:SDR family NAD(P)-dependent oxidoreductase n=1 Tax=Compostibacter hankyongensis TaxID=1007089 RepID=A0ABP8FIP5_9BACT
MDKNAGFDLSGKTALVTGGGSGLGFAISKILIQSGARVIIIGRQEAKLAEACEKLGSQCSYKVFDLSAVEKIKWFVETLEAENGPLDVLVNNAGIHLKKDTLSVSDEEYQRVIRINQQAVFALTREVSVKMVERQAGCVIMISSMASQYGLPKVIAYTAAKSAVEGMTRALAVELSPLGVRVNCVAPGFIATDMSAGALNNDKERMARVLTRTPIGRLGEPDDIGYAVTYLASEAARYVTGVVLPVDGGNSIGF